MSENDIRFWGIPITEDSLGFLDTFIDEQIRPLCVCLETASLFVVRDVWSSPELAILAGLTGLSVGLYGLAMRREADKLLDQTMLVDPKV